MDSVEGSLWLASQTPNILCYFTPEQLEEEMASRFASVTSEEIIQLFFSGVYYLTVLVYAKTTIHLSVGG